MLLRLRSVLGVAELDTVNALLDAAEFQDGRISAGVAAAQVKNNQELSPQAAQQERLNRIVMGNLVNHPVYRAAALPARVAAPFYARYQTGMGYGAHVDDPIMGDGPHYRSDIAVTVFLSEPDSYQGGDLVVQTSFGEQAIKYSAGDAVLYPASTRHRVDPVRGGTRLVAVTWVQSMVRDPQRREIIYQLYQARERLLSESPDSSVTTQVDSAYVNLVRMWSEL